jgi:signal transduction histidine kinase
MDRRQAFYTNLRPGAYRFLVKASNAHGVWNEEPTVLNFIIRPFFWQTKVFYASLGFAAIGAVWIGHERRLRSQRKRAEQVQREMLLQEKTRIAADMHDEVGAKLTQIAILGELAKANRHKPEDAEATLNRISQAARDLTSSMSELIWATNPNNDTLENLVAHLREIASSQLDDTGLETHLAFPVSVPDICVTATVRRNFVLILKEALNNVIKHAAAKRVEVALSFVAGQLQLTVSDDGNGISIESGNSNRNGLKNMGKRAADMAGNFEVENLAGRGTRIGVSATIENPVRV